MIEIKNRFTGAVVCSGETLLEAVSNNRTYLRDADLRGADLRDADLGGADLGGAYLRDADLRGADLRDADLGGADLRDAYLRDAYLRGADLRDADLRGADLRGADLGGADLGGAYLRGADLGGADLRDAKLSWQSHDLLAEVLRRSAGDDVAKLKIAGLILICREKCWEDFLQIRDPLSGWALDVLAEWVQDDDGAPECVRRRSHSEAGKK